MMTARKNILLVVFVLTCLSALYSFWLKQSEPHEVLIEPGSLVENSVDNTKADQVSQVANAGSSATRPPGTLIQTQKTGKHAATDSNPPLSSYEDVDPEEKLKTLLDNQIGDGAEYVGKTYDEIMQQRENRFVEEPVDREWASAYEEKLNRAIGTDATLSEYAIQSIECKSRQCRILVYLPDERTADIFSTNLVELLVSDKSGLKNSGVFSNYSEETGIATLYLGRDDQVRLF